MRLLYVLWIASAGSAASGDQPVVEVFFPAASGLARTELFERAHVIASRIYSDMGIRLIWRGAAHHPESCFEDAPNRQIVMAFTTKHPQGMHTQALAYSSVYGGSGPCVMLLEEELTAAARLNPRNTSVLLGHVLAHEIGHVLQGVARHSETGIMKVHWSQREIIDMNKVWLQFTPLDRDLIFAGLNKQLLATARSR
jgi:hypothetical protein